MEEKEQDVLLSMEYQRPDVEAAEKRLEAAKKREQSAQANLYPRFGVAGQVSRQFSYSTKDEEINSIDTYGLSTSISIPIFQGGALWSGYQASQANTQMAALSLSQSKLRVEQAIAQVIENEQAVHQMYVTAKEQHEIAELALTEASRLYREGLTPSFNLIAIQQSFIQAKTNLIQSKRDVLSSRLQTYSVFGGSILEKSQ